MTKVLITFMIIICIIIDFYGFYVSGQENALDELQYQQELVRGL